MYQLSHGNPSTNNTKPRGRNNEIILGIQHSKSRPVAMFMPLRD